MLKSIINIFFIAIVSTMLGQEQAKDAVVASDSIVVSKKYPISFKLGFDIGRFGYAQFNQSQSYDLEFEANYKLYSAVFDIGFEKKFIDSPLLQYDVSGSFFKVGLDYNLYDNWSGMDNVISLGVRFGHAGYSGNLYRYTINQPNNVWQPEPKQVNINFTGLSANWIEIVGKIQVETFKNVFLGYTISVKELVNYSKIDTFEMGYIPGFYVKNSYSDLGFGMQYFIIYKFGF